MGSGAGDQPYRVIMYSSESHSGTSEPSRYSGSSRVIFGASHFKVHSGFNYLITLNDLSQLFIKINMVRTRREPSLMCGYLKENRYHIS